MLIAVKQNNHVAVALSDAGITLKLSQKDGALYENVPYFKVKSNKDCYVFVDNLSVAYDILKAHEFIFCNVTDMSSLITTVVPKIKQLFKSYLLLDDNGEMSNRILVVKGDKMFDVCYDFKVVEYSDYVTYNHGDTTITTLEFCKADSAKQTLLNTLRCLAKGNVLDVWPATIVDVTNNKTMLVSKQKTMQ